jgi:hypothetical protein
VPPVAGSLASVWRPLAKTLFWGRGDWHMTDAERRSQARRARMTLRKAHLGDTEVDPTPVSGAEAVSLVHRLTRMSYSLAGDALPVCARAQIPCRFVRRRAT